MVLKGKKIFILLLVIIAGISSIKTYHLYFRDFDNNEIFKSVSRLNSSAPEAPAGKSYTFAVMGDNKNSISTFKKIITSINSKPSIAFTMNTGDMVFDGNPIKYDFFLKQLKLFNNPMLPAPGNHDVADGGIERYLDIFGPLYYSFTYGSSIFIVLNDSNEENIDPWQMRWFKQELDRSKKYAHTFVFMHVPVYDPRKSLENQPGHSLKDLDSAEKVRTLMKKYNIDMVFAGHIHGYFKGSWSGVPYTITGGGGAEMLLSDPAHYFYHYIEVTVNGSKVNYKIVKMNSPDFNITDRIGAFLWIYFYSFIVINYWLLLLIVTFSVLLAVYIKGYGGGFPFTIRRRKKK